MNTLSWIVDPSFTTRLTLALLHFLWQGCAGGLLVVVCGALFKHASARFRYTQNVAALILMAACLPVTFCLVEIPATRVNQTLALPKISERAPADTALDKQQTSSVARVDPVASDITESRQAPAGSIATPDVVQSPAEVMSSSEPPENLLTTSMFQFVSRWVAALYLLGVALILGRLLRGVWGGRRLRKIASIIDDAPLLEMVNKLARRLGLKVVPAVAWCGQISIPVVVGIVKPMILLPAAVVSGLTPDQLQALLLHELAHIRRFDPIVNLLQRIIEAVLFFHPVVWFVSRRISIVREHAADDMVLAAGWDRPVYADALVRAAELASAFSRPDLARRATVLGASGTSQSEFKLRVLRLLEESQAPKLQLSRAGVLALLMVVALGCMLAWSQTDKVETASDRSAIGDSLDATSAQANHEQLIQAVLPNGTVVELINLTTSSRSAPAQHHRVWWKGNGMPDEEANAQEVPPEFINRAPLNARFVYVRAMTEIPEPSLCLRTLPARESRFASYADGKDQIGSPVRTLSAEFGPVDGEESTSLQIGITSESWGDWQQISPTGELVNKLDKSRPHWSSYQQINLLKADPVRHFVVAPEGTPVDPNHYEDSEVVLEWPRNHEELWAFEFRAVSTDGQTHSGFIVSSDNGEDPCTTTYHLKGDVFRDQLARFEYRLRPYRHWVTFENVSLQPGHVTDVKVSVAALPDEPTANAVGQRDLIRINLKLPRHEFLLGESISLEYEMTNEGQIDAPYSKGAFYPDLRINDGFRMSAVQVDQTGRPVGEPVAGWTKPQDAEGKAGGFQLKPGETHSATLFVTRHLRFLEPGRYRLRVENVNRFEREPTRPFSAGETIITLGQPTLAEARRVFAKMKQAPRQAYDDNAMKFLPDAADFQAIHQPVYLPILKEFALAGDLDALQALERMESKGANEVLVDVLSKALDRDDWRTARACYQHLKSFLPFPGWYGSTSSEQDQANRDRVARTWGADFVPVLTRLARRLSVEVAAQMRARETAPRDADAQNPEFLKVFQNGYFPPEHPQSLLIDIDYIYRCVGRPEDLADCLAAFAQSIELTKSLPLETHQYFRPRGSAYGFRHTVVYLIQRGAQVPRQPAHPGELAAFALALRNQPGFRPEGWQTVVAKWLQSGSPYLAEMILDYLPEPVPGEVLDYLPTALADDYIGLKIAACQVAQKNPRAAYREPLQKILDRADDKYLRKYAVDAARANGLSAHYDEDAPFVEKSKAASEPPEKKKEGPGEQSDSNAGNRSVKAGPRAFLLPDHWIVTSVGFDHGDKELVTASMQSFATIRRWDVVGKKLISEIKLAGDKHGRSFREGTLMLSGDRRRAIAATDDYVGIWDTATGKLDKMLPFPKKEWDYDCIGLLAATPDLSVIVGSLTTSYDRMTLVYDGHTLVWDGVSGKTLRIITHKHATRIMALSLSSDGKRLATTNGSGATIWDTSTGQQLLYMPNDNKGRKHSDPEVSNQYHNHVWSVQFSPNGKQLAIGDILGVKLVDADSGKLLQQLEGPYRYSSGLGHPNLVFSKDGQLLARLGTGDRTGEKGTAYVVPIWSTQTGQKLFELPTDANDGAFSDDNQRFAIGLSDLQMGLAVWQLNGGAVDTEQTDGPGPEPRQDKVEENGHYRGKKAAEFIGTYKPTWSDAKLGIQYGIALTNPRRQFHFGERVPLVVFFRNASDKPLKIDMSPDYCGNTPLVLNAQGAAIEFEKALLLGTIPHYVQSLEPGEAVGPFYLNFGLGENPRPGKQNWHPYIKTPIAGPYKLTHTVSINVSGLQAGDQSKSEKITSGQIEFEIVVAPKTADGGSSKADVASQASAVLSKNVSEDRQSIEALLELFSNADYFWQQHEVARKIIELGDQEAISRIRPYVESESRRTRCTAGLIMASLGDPRGRDIIINELQDTKPRPIDPNEVRGKPDLGVQIVSDRYYAALLLGELRDKAAVPALIVATEDETINYRAAISLGEIGDRQAIPALRKMVKESPKQRLWAGYGLAALGESDGFEILIETTSDASWTQRRHAVEALGTIGDPKMIPTLVKALKDEHSNVRVSAAQSLAKIGDAAALPALTEALNDPAATETNAPTTVASEARKAIDAIEAKRKNDKQQAVQADGPGILLADAVRNFNAENKRLGQGLDQPELTADEVVEFITRSDRKRDAKDLNDREYAAFKAVAESKRLPPDSYLQVYTEEPHDVFVVNHLWQVRLMLPAIGHDGFVGLTIRDTKVAEEKIDPREVAWGRPDAAGLSLGAYLSPKKEKYQIGERVRLRLFVRNDGQKAVSTTWANTSHPMPEDFTVTDEKGTKVAVRKGQDGNWLLPWISGYMSGGLASGDVHRLLVPYAISIGGDGSNKLVGRVIDARAGQTLQLRVRESNGNDRDRGKGEPEPESGSITFTIADAPATDTPIRIDQKPEIPSNHFLVSFNETPWKDVLLWYGRVMGSQIELKVVPPGKFSYDNPRPLNHVEIIQLIKGELLRRGYCFAGDGEQLSVQTADVVARRYEKALRDEFLHGHKLRQGPDKFDAYFEIVDVRVVGATEAPAPSGPAIAYLLKANRDFSAQEATVFWRSCIFENSITSLKTGQPIVVDGFAVLYKGKWLGTNVPALEKGERIEIWQNEFEEWNARPPSDMRVVIEGRTVGQGGKPVAARIRQFLMEGKIDDLGDSDLPADPKLQRATKGKTDDLDHFLTWAYGGDLIVDKQGKFQVTLRHGTQFVRTAYLYAIAPGYAPQRVGPLAVGYEKPAAPLTIELQPGFTGRLRLVHPDGKPLDKGEVEVIAQDDLQAEGFPVVRLPINGKPIAVEHCPAGPLLLKVRVPGFAEQVIRDVRLAADEATDVKVALD